MAQNRFLQLNFSIEGEKQVSRAFDYKGRQLDDFTKPLKKSQSLLLNTWDQNFDSQGAILGKPWQKRTRAYPWRMLQKSGAMRGGFQNELQRTQTRLWNAAHYFRYHQSNKPRRKLPRRVMMMIDDKRRVEIQRFFTMFLNEVVSNNP